MRGFGKQKCTEILSKLFIHTHYAYTQERNKMHKGTTIHPEKEVLPSHSHA